MQVGHSQESIVLLNTRIFEELLFKTKSLLANLVYENSTLAGYDKNPETPAIKKKNSKVFCTHKQFHNESRVVWYDLMSLAPTGCL